ncbi:MAG: hypothetical protein QW756_00390 [Nitrososphaerota archaeon]
MEGEECLLPSHLFYGQRGGVWTRLDGGLLVVVLTHPQLCLIGRPIAIRFPDVRNVEMGGYLAVVEMRRFYGPVLSPLDGVVV